MRRCTIQCREIIKAIKQTAGTRSPEALATTSAGRLVTMTRAEATPVARLHPAGLLWEAVRAAAIAAAARAVLLPAAAVAEMRRYANFNDLFS